MCIDFVWGDSTRKNFEILSGMILSGAILVHNMKHAQL